MMSEARPEPTSHGALFATPQEARDAIDSLHKADHAKLLVIARGFARTRLRNSVISPEDLLHDAIVKTLDGRRRWNRRVSVLKHLDRVMESDAGHVVEQQLAHGIGQLPDNRPEPPAQEPSPEARLQARDEFADLVALFSEDETVLKLLRLKGDGYSASEIQRELGMGRTQYDTATKRIRRRLAKHLAEGGQ